MAGDNEKKEKVAKPEVKVPLWFEEQGRISPETWEILEERSRELATEKISIVKKEGGTEFLGFRWSDTRCYLQVNQITEVREFEYLEPVPTSREFLVGLANLRGEVVPVFDLRYLWQISREEVTEDSKIIILDKGTQKFGFWVDEVFGTFEESIDAITPAHQYSGQLNNEYTLGVLPKSHELWMVINADAIIASEELIIEDK